MIHPQPGAIQRAQEPIGPRPVVKVVVSVSGRALYFSRRAIPFLREAASRSIPEPLAASAFFKLLGSEIEVE